MTKGGNVMILNPSSWHYRIWKGQFQTGTRLPAKVGICDYFWTVVKAVVSPSFKAFGLLLLTLGILLLAIAGIVTLMFMFALPLLALGSLLAGESNQDLLAPGPAAMKYALLILVGIVGTVFVVKWVSPRLRSQQARDTIQLLKEFLKAKKDRVCPVLEVPDAGSEVE